MLKKIFLIVRKIVFSFFLLYGLNLMLNNIDVFIPINIISLLIVSVLDIPGLILLIILFFLL